MAAGGRDFDGGLARGTGAGSVRAVRGREDGCRGGRPRRDVAARAARRVGQAARDADAAARRDLGSAVAPVAQRRGVQPRRRAHVQRRLFGRRGHRACRAVDAQRNGGCGARGAAGCGDRPVEQLRRRRDLGCALPAGRALHRTEAGHHQRARRPGRPRAPAQHRPQQLLPERAGDCGHLSEHPRLCRLRPGVRGARQRPAPGERGQGHRRAARLDRGAARARQVSRDDRRAELWRLRRAGVGDRLSRSPARREPGVRHHRLSIVPGVHRRGAAGQPERRVPGIPRTPRCGRSWRASRR